MSDPRPEISRVLYGLRKGDLYIAIERRGPLFVIVHEHPIGSSSVRATVEVSLTVARQLAEAITAEIAADAERAGAKDVTPLDITQGGAER